MGPQSSFEMPIWLQNIDWKTDDCKIHQIVIILDGVNSSMFALIGSDWSMMDDIITVNSHGKPANLDQKIILLCNHILKMFH